MIRATCPIPTVRVKTDRGGGGEGRGKKSRGEEGAKQQCWFGVSAFPQSVITYGDFSKKINLSGVRGVQRGSKREEKERGRADEEKKWYSGRRRQRDFLYFLSLPLLPPFALACCFLSLSI